MRFRVSGVTCVPFFSATDTVEMETFAILATSRMVAILPNRFCKRCDSKDIRGRFASRNGGTPATDFQTLIADGFLRRDL
jgi:hypothetical protein